MTTSKSLSTNKLHLTTQSYKTPDKLNIRILTHDKYTQPKIDFMAWVLDKIQWRGDETVIDVGCGACAYVAPTRQRSRCYIAGDLSLGMLQGLSYSGLSRLNLDVQRLPLADGTVDVVLANHMLYHVPDKEVALAEISRVLRPDGYLLAATNSADNMVELIDLRRQSIEQLGGTAESFLERSPVADIFSLEDGRSILQKQFPHVERHDLSSALIFPNPAPILDYLRSSKDWYEHFLPSGITGDDSLEAVRTILDEHFLHKNEFRVSKLSGVFVCRL